MISDMELYASNCMTREEQTHLNARRTFQAKRPRQARYKKSPKGRETDRAYASSPKGLETHHRYNMSPKGRERDNRRRTNGHRTKD